jgi:hypothetical protein
MRFMWDNAVRFIGGAVRFLWDHVPPLRDAHDPVVALILWVVLFFAVGAGILTIPLDWSIADTLPVFGGIIVLLGSYFAARTLREIELDKATQMLASESRAVRAAGIHRLKTVFESTPRYRDYVETTFEAYVRKPPESDDDGARLANSILVKPDGSACAQEPSTAPAPGNGTN